MHLGGLALVLAGLMRSWIPFAVVYTLWAIGNAVTGPVFSLITGHRAAGWRQAASLGRRQGTDDDFWGAGVCRRHRQVAVTA